MFLTIIGVHALIVVEMLHTIVRTTILQVVQLQPPVRIIARRIVWMEDKVDRGLS